MLIRLMNASKLWNWTSRRSSSCDFGVSIGRFCTLSIEDIIQLWFLIICVRLDECYLFSFFFQDFSCCTDGVWESRRILYFMVKVTFKLLSGRKFCFTNFKVINDLIFSPWRLPMYSEAKVAFFVYLWYPKTRVGHLLSCNCTICYVGYISLVQTLTYNDRGQLMSMKLSFGRTSQSMRLRLIVTCLSWEHGLGTWLSFIHKGLQAMARQDFLKFYSMLLHNHNHSHQDLALLRCLFKMSSISYCLYKRCSHIVPYLLNTLLSLFLSFVGCCFLSRFCVRQDDYCSMNRVIHTNFFVYLWEFSWQSSHKKKWID